MLFAKNSDRPPNEAQVVEWHTRRPPGAALRTQYLTLPDDDGAAGLLGSRPVWLWGLEHGVNEHGVAAGNEKIWTVEDPRAAPPALIGMDLVRLALERARTAESAVEVLTCLLERHGQGGSCERDRDRPYFSSFLLADPRDAWIVETSGRRWAARHAPAGAAISNRISLTTDWDRASVDVAPGTDVDAWRPPSVPTNVADHRLATTTGLVRRGLGVDARALAATLRDHGGTVALPPDPGSDGRGITVCMHVRGRQATTASMITELRDDGAPARAWLALGSPCVSVYVPAFLPALPAELADARQWHRFARLRDRVEADAAALEPVQAVLAPVEAALWDEADELAVSGDVTAMTSFAKRAYEPVDAALATLGV
jgi:hypothetical protein